MPSSVISSLHPSRSGLQLRLLGSLMRLRRYQRIAATLQMQLERDITSWTEYGEMAMRNKEVGLRPVIDSLLTYETSVCRQLRLQIYFKNYGTAQAKPRSTAPS